MKNAFIIHSVDSYEIGSVINRTSVFVFESYEPAYVHHDINLRTVTIYQHGTVQMVVTSVVMWRRDNDYQEPIPAIAIPTSPLDGGPV